MNFTILEEEEKKKYIEYFSNSNPWILESTLTLEEKNHLFDIMYELKVIWDRHYLETDNVFYNTCNIKKYLILQQIFLHYYLIDESEKKFRNPNIRGQGGISDHCQIDRYLDFIKPIFFFPQNIKKVIYFIDLPPKVVLNYTQKQLENIPKPIFKKFGGWRYKFCETSFTDINSEDEWFFNEDDLTQYKPLCIEVFLSNPMCVMQTFKDNFHIAIPLEININTKMFLYKKFCKDCLCNNENNCLYSYTNYVLFCRAEGGRPNYFKKSLKDCIIMLEKEIEKFN
jgi:hypothetical protein